MPVAYDVVVLGLGAMGAAATYQLAKRGARVLGIDRYSPPHEFGSTHGDTRITRIACGEGPEYSAFAARSHQVWRELESELGVDLLHPERAPGDLRAGQAGRQPQRAAIPRGNGRGGEKGEDRLRDSRHRNDQGALSGLQCHGRRRGLSRRCRRLRASRALHQRPVAAGPGPGSGAAAERDGHFLRSVGRLGHGEDGQGHVPREGADRGGGSVGAWPAPAVAGRSVQGDSAGALLVPRQERARACAILA